MTNENQKKSPLKKYKFLVPQIVNLGFIGFVCFLMGRFDMFVTIAFVMTTILATVYSRLIYKFDNDSEYRVMAIKRIEESKKLSTKHRYLIAGELEVFVVFGVLFLALLVVDGVSKREFSGVMILVLFVLVAFCIVKVVKNLFFKK